LAAGCGHDFQKFFRPGQETVREARFLIPSLKARRGKNTQFCKQAVCL
jgi:hypothetical protein